MQAAKAKEAHVLDDIASQESEEVESQESDSEEDEERDEREFMQFLKHQVRLEVEKSIITLFEGEPELKKVADRLKEE